MRVCKRVTFVLFLIGQTAGNVFFQMHNTFLIEANFSAF